MRILSIESSCDETSASVIELTKDSINVLSTITATSLDIHASTGGIIPENASRMQVKYIIPVIVESLINSKGVASGGGPPSSTRNLSETNGEDVGRGRSEDRTPETWEEARQILKNDIDAIAVTYGPGLIGSLLVGVETAKTLAYVFDKPIIPVNHLLAHIYANFIQRTGDSVQKIEFPFVGLIVSGGHTDLLIFKNHGDYQWLGGTRDDAAGEAFDKIGRVLGLPYPAGPEMERRALLSQTLTSDAKIKFKSPLIQEDNFDFSFSGLKSEAMRFIKTSPLSSPLKEEDAGEDNLTNEICHATQKAIIDVLVKKTLKASEKYNCKNILVGGGVSANNTLIKELKLNAERCTHRPEIFFPEKIYCTDNGAMIGAYALLNLNEKNWKEVSANPDLYFA